MSYTIIIEDMLKELRNYFDDYSKYYIDDINVNDSIKLKYFKEISIDDNDPYNSPVYPVVNLFMTDYTEKRLSIGNNECLGIINAVIAVNEGSTTNILTKLYRYIEVIRSLLKDYSEHVTTFDVDPETEITINIYTSPELSVKVGLVRFGIIKDVSAFAQDITA